MFDFRSPLTRTRLRQMAALSLAALALILVMTAAKLPTESNGLSGVSGLQSPTVYTIDSLTAHRILADPARSAS
jgi:hypothetical protein